MGSRASRTKAPLGAMGPRITGHPRRGPRRLQPDNELNHDAMTASTARPPSHPMRAHAPFWDCYDSGPCRAVLASNEFRDAPGVPIDMKSQPLALSTNGSTSAVTDSQISIANKPSPHSRGNRIARLCWGVVQGTLFRMSPRPCRRWRRFLLKSFGATLAPGAKVGPRARIWGPWNLEMGEHSTISDDVDVYCVAPIRIGSHTTISQYSYLCGATHDHTHPRFPLEPYPITIGSGCWVAADVYVAPGVTIGDRTVVGARSSVFGDLPEGKICVGSPAKPIKDRVVGDATPHANLPAGERPDDAAS